MSYTNKLLIANYLKRSLSEDEEAMLVVLIPAVEQYIDGKCDTVFRQVDPTTRYYDSEGLSTIEIDSAYDITAVRALNLNGTDRYTYTVDLEYVVGPLNSYIKTEIYRRYGRFPIGNGIIAVTGRFSEWCNGVPADIKAVATRLAGGLLTIDKTDSTGTYMKQEDIEGHSIMYDRNGEIFDHIATEDKFVKAVLSQRSGVLIG